MRGRRACLFSWLARRETKACFAARRGECCVCGGGREEVRASRADRNEFRHAAPVRKQLLVGRVKVEVLHPSSSDGFRMTGEGEAAGSKGKRGQAATRPFGWRARGVRGLEFDRTWTAWRRGGGAGGVGANENVKSRSLSPFGMTLAERGRGKMFPATVPIRKPSHDPSTVRLALAFASGGKNRPLRSG
jgi:hypothetical protein